VHTRKYSLRFILAFVFLIACLLFFSVRLVLIQVFRSSYLAQLAEKQHNNLIKLEPRRGAIYDRHRRPLAVNITVYSLYANPRLMSAENKDNAVRHLSILLNMDPAFLQERLDRNKYFIWLARKLSEEAARQIKALNISGLDFIKENKRYYPNKSLAAHLIGFAGIDNQGLEGLEMVYNDLLQGQPGWSRILRDARQRELLIENGFIPPKDGFNLILTIDETIQYIAEQALDKAYKQHHAKWASIVVIDPKTGEVLALANRPTYDLQNIAESSVESRTNRAVAFTYEPGSVFKIVTAAAALEEEIAKESDKFFCENGQYRIANHVLKDHHPHGTLTFREVFEQSSNIGVAKIAQKMGPQRLYDYARRFRFGMKTNIDIAGEAAGMLKPPSTWSKTSIGAIPMGHEVTVTPVQLASAIATVANNGVYMKPFMVKYIKDNQDESIKEFQPIPVDRVISEDTALRVKDILRGAVEKGTGKRARITGVKVGGKTGTAQKVINGVYSHNKFFASFIGFAPVDDPKVAVAVVFDEPHPSYYGGTVAAPVFQEVVEKALKYLESTGHYNPQ
jgi:cell division protein FtsI/penicillin-binding protein 2